MPCRVAPAGTLLKELQKHPCDGPENARQRQEPKSRIDRATDPESQSHGEGPFSWTTITLRCSPRLVWPLSSRVRGNLPRIAESRWPTDCAAKKDREGGCRWSRPP